MVVLPALLLAFGLQDPVPFSSPEAIAEPNRIALSPVLDGNFAPEEWDPFAQDTFFQWEPGKLHFAARGTAGHPVVVSIDLGGNGWLVGKDNVEIRFDPADPNPRVRILDATNVAGPAWKDSLALSTALTTKYGAGEGGAWTVEATLDDPGLNMLADQPNSPIGLRFDSIDPAAPDEPFRPRAMASCKLVTERALSLPNGLTWSPEGPGRTVAADNRTKIRLTFKGKNELGIKRIEMRGEGLVRDSVESAGKPFPEFDRKGRAFVDFDTLIAKDALPGYRVARAVLTDATGAMHVLQTSFAIQPLITFDLQYPDKIAASNDPRTVRFGVFVRSHSPKRIDGTLDVKAPEGWKIEKGNGKRFIITNPHGSRRQVFELMIPGGFNGTIPLDLGAEIGDRKISQRVWLTVPRG